MAASQEPRIKSLSSIDYLITPTETSMEYSPSPKMTPTVWPTVKTGGPAISRIEGELPKLFAATTLTPPISPAHRRTSTATEARGKEDGESRQTADPVLFNSQASSAQIPLFHHGQRVKDAVSHNVNPDSDRRDFWTEEQPAVARADKPSKDDYRLMTEFVGKLWSKPMESRVYQLYSQDPAAYIAQERGYWQQYKELGAKGLGAKRHPTSRQRQSPAKFRALVPTPAGIRKNRTAAVLPKVIKEGIQIPRRSPVSPARDDSRSVVVPVAKKAVIKKISPEPDFDSLPDYCPPLSTLSLPPYNDNVKCLQTKWAAGSIDLAKDPHRDLLHPAELYLASGLRLSCARYLANKRAIFAKRLDHLKNNLTFSKTHAQQAGKIDVNKASRLWEAFNSVGWFDAKHFQKWLD